MYDEIFKNFTEILKYFKTPSLKYFMKYFTSKNFMTFYITIFNIISVEEQTT